MNVFKKYIPVIMYDDTGNGIDILNSETLTKKQIKDWDILQLGKKQKNFKTKKQRFFCL